MAMRMLSWALPFALLGLAAGQISTSNASTAAQGSSGVFELQVMQGSNNQNISQLVPLTRVAVKTPMLTSPLFNANDTSYLNISKQSIAYISCDPADYPGNINANTVFQTVVTKEDINLTATIFYSTSTDYCNYTDVSAAMDDEFKIYSMTNKGDSAKLLDTLRNLGQNMIFYTQINRAGASSGNNSANSQSQQNQNPLGPSPSTAVAMIILYSITGIITALFLVIIITGAVRAHRHPDRYGPRDVLGRPRQSRARGLGRAILDTIPIVKFGDKDEAKPTDVEMNAPAQTRDVEDHAAETTGATGNHEASETQSADQSDGDHSHETTRNIQDSGIAPAQPLAAATATSSPDHAAADEGLGCSICTDDFEKGQDIRVLPCNHKFHPECVDPWLLNVSGTCPLCRVDLRPTTSHTSAGDDEQDPDALAPPLEPETNPSDRRRSALRGIMGLRSRPNASAEERISALRRLREQRRNTSGDVASGSANESLEDVTSNRRSRRISVRLHDVFSVRTRRGHEHDEAGSSSEQPAGPSIVSPVAEHPPTLQSRNSHDDDETHNGPSRA